VKFNRKDAKERKDGKIYRKLAYIVSKLMYGRVHRSIGDGGNFFGNYLRPQLKTLKVAPKGVLQGVLGGNGAGNGQGRTLNAQR
jgi:hypothetical protein